MKLLVDNAASAVSGGFSLSQSAAGLLRGLELLSGQLRQIDSEEKIAAILEEVPETTPEQLKAFGGFVAQVPGALTELIRERERLDVAVAELPSGRTGPKTISTLEKVSICQQVTALIGIGCRQGAAILRVSQRTGRSARSVRRIYEQRGKLQTVFTVDEVKSFFLGILYGNGINPNMLARFVADDDDFERNDQANTHVRE